MTQPTEQSLQTTIQTKTVSFDNIGLNQLLFNESYRLSRGSASQLVLGFKHMLTKLGEGTNDYQRTLYPQLRTITEEIINSYETTFLTQTEPVYKQVFGANLNGTRNDGSLYRSINSNVNRSLTYGYVQFGQLIKVLTNRLNFISQRDPQLIERYKSSKEEMDAYLQLQLCTNTFLQFLDQQNKKWTEFITFARTTHNIQPSQYQLRIKKQYSSSNFTQKRNL
jgi:hypothetical protein